MLRHHRLGQVQQLLELIDRSLMLLFQQLHNSQPHGVTHAAKQVRGKSDQFVAQFCRGTSLFPSFRVLDYQSVLSALGPCHWIQYTSLH